MNTQSRISSDAPPIRKSVYRDTKWIQREEWFFQQPPEYFVKQARRARVCAVAELSQLKRWLESNNYDHRLAHWDAYREYITRRIQPDLIWQMLGLAWMYAVADWANESGATLR